ncbi:nicotinate phosphoribosyltransferase [Myxococcota bacterium]|nr:nicotinate phosphoribosyltransferase [Myxococcota bacterium]MBU1380930.1 nicotinate phosphoribosyltransferase [Myxococcota bacterium]MBU1498482.1 nicotinate phosphoribosyltransferase [Myxococcota bacterium]
MITGLTDNDLYKFTMQQAVFRLYPEAWAKYAFINRGKTAFPHGFADALTEEVRSLAGFELTSDEYTFLKNRCYYLSPVYLDFLSHYRFNPDEVSISQQGENLEIHIEGPWYRTILWEVPLMALISELYFTKTGTAALSREVRKQKNIDKTRRFIEGSVSFADFGTRRRFSSDNHREVIEDILSVPQSTMTGTSNVFLAMKYALRPIGTHAHEWFMFHAALNGYRLANKTSTDAWTEVYKGNLGIALTDTFTTDNFLISFDSVKARLFDGVRHDSGNPFEFAEKMIAHYIKLHIDPTTKTIVFSDGLDPDKVLELQRYCNGRIRCSFGIGTNLTNDVGVKPLNMVIKMSHARFDEDSPWIGTVKLSDVQGKHTGSDEEIDLCLRTLKRGIS